MSLTKHSFPLITGTVISIHENPFPRSRQAEGYVGNDAQKMAQLLNAVRQNIRLIFAGASKQHSGSSSRDTLVTIRIRQLVDAGPSHDHARIRQEDGPSLLFYYIFDDWASSYGLIVKREHPYGALLDELVGNPILWQETFLNKKVCTTETKNARIPQSPVDRRAALVRKKAWCVEETLPKL